MIVEKKSSDFTRQSNDKWHCMYIIGIAYWHFRAYVKKLYVSMSQIHLAWIRSGSIKIGQNLNPQNFQK